MFKALQIQTKPVFNRTRSLFTSTDDAIDPNFVSSLLSVSFVGLQLGVTVVCKQVIHIISRPQHEYERNDEHLSAPPCYVQLINQPLPEFPKVNRTGYITAGNLEAHNWLSICKSSKSLFLQFYISSLKLEPFLEESFQFLLETESY